MGREQGTPEQGTPEQGTPEQGTPEHRNREHRNREQFQPSGYPQFSKSDPGKCTNFETP